MGRCPHEWITLELKGTIVAGVGGRQPGVPNRDKAELRALIQDRVHEFTIQRRKAEIAELMAGGMSEEEANEAAVQDVIEDYDPVAQMAIIAVDMRNKQDVRVKCHDSVAQYVRPKLKSVEVTTDPEALETLAQREALSSRLVGLLEAAASAKQAAPPALDEDEPG